MLSIAAGRLRHASAILPLHTTVAVLHRFSMKLFRYSLADPMELPKGELFVKREASSIKSR